MSRLTSLLAVLVTLACAAPAWPAEAGVIRGVVTYTGPVTNKTLPVTIDNYVCGKDKPSEELVVGPQRGLKNVVVWLQNPPAGAAWRPGPRAWARMSW